MKSKHIRLARIKQAMRSGDIGWPTGPEFFAVVMAKTPEDEARARAAIAQGRLERVEKFFSDVVGRPAPLHQQ